MKRILTEKVRLILISLTNPSPSKFSSGISSLWRGISIEFLNEFFVESFFERKYLKTNSSGWSCKNDLYFDSARSAITFTLSACNIGDGDEVIVSAFTCDAVSYAVLETGAKITYVDINADLTMNDQCVFDAINCNTKAIIMQNTFGKLGLNTLTISKLKDRGFLVIEDNCLSAGSKVLSRKFGSFGDIAVSSLEVSKAVTIGWGGVLTINNEIYDIKFRKKYKYLKQISFIKDIHRLIQLWISVLLVRVQPYGGVVLWYVFYGFKIFRKSSTNNINAFEVMSRLGVFSTNLLTKVNPQIEKWYELTQRNVLELDSYAAELGLQKPFEISDTDYCVSPRISILIEPSLIDMAMKLAEDERIEVGRWFTDVPPKFRLSECKIHSSNVAEATSRQILSLPCYWTLSRDEIIQIKKYMRRLNELTNKR